MEVNRAEHIQAVATLKRNADELEDARAKQQLLSAVASALKWCTRTEKPECEAAANKTYR